MAKTRVHELAKEFGVESKFVLEKLKEMGEFVKSASSTVEPPVEMRFKKQYGEELKSSGGSQESAPAASSPSAGNGAAPAARSGGPSGGGPRPGPRPGPRQAPAEPRLRDAVALLPPRGRLALLHGRRAHEIGRAHV